MTPPAIGRSLTHLPAGYQGPLLGPPPPSRWPTPMRLPLRDPLGRFRRRRVSKQAEAIRFQIATRWSSR